VIFVRGSHQFLVGKFSDIQAALPRQNLGFRERLVDVSGDTVHRYSVLLECVPLYSSNQLVPASNRSYRISEGERLRYLCVESLDVCFRQCSGAYLVHNSPIGIADNGVTW
jgi:hypothetical protein